MASEKLELVVHPLCPYAQRALFTASYKSVPVEITYVSLANPEPWFLELNPRGEVPSLRVTIDGQVHKLTESLNISEYFDSFPGPSLYPRDADGKVCALSKCLIDVFIKIKIGKFTDVYYSAFYWQASSDEIEEFKKTMEDFNQILEGGNYIGNKLLGKNELTFPDIMLYPHVERLHIHRDDLPEALKNVDFSNIWAWYERLRTQPWANSVPETTPARLHKALQMVKNGSYQGLLLPLTAYDE